MATYDEQLKKLASKLANVPLEQIISAQADQDCDMPTAYPCSCGDYCYCFSEPATHQWSISWHMTEPSDKNRPWSSYGSHKYDYLHELLKAIVEA